MNKDITNKQGMQEIFRALKQAIELNTTSSKRVTLDRVVKACNPSYKITLDDAKILMNGLINAKYIRFFDASNGKRYFQPSMQGEEKWKLFIAATLHDLDTHAERMRIKREEDDVPWVQDEVRTGS